MAKYIYENPNWPNFNWDNEKIALLLNDVKLLQAKLLGKMSSLGFEIQLFATTVIGDKVLIINAPILIGGDFSNSALIVNEIMESLIITKNE